MIRLKKFMLSTILSRSTNFSVSDNIWHAWLSGIYSLGKRYSPKSIQEAPMSDPNPRRKPMKNQTLAPWFPKQPVV